MRNTKKSTILTNKVSNKKSINILPNFDANFNDIIALIKPTNRRYYDRKDNKTRSNYVVDYFVLPSKLITKIVLGDSYILEKLGYSLLSRYVENVRFNVLTKKDTEDYQRMLNQDYHKSFKLNIQGFDLETKFSIQIYDFADLLNKDLFNKNHPSSFFPADNRYSVFLFRNVSWEDVTLFFRKSDIVLSGGNPSARSFLTHEKITLSNVILSMVSIYQFGDHSKNNERFPISLYKDGIFNPFHINIYDEYLKQVLKPRYDLQVRVEEELIDISILKTLFNKNIVNTKLNVNDTFFHKGRIFANIIERASHLEKNPSKLDKNFLVNIKNFINIQMSELMEKMIELIKFQEVIRETKIEVTPEVVRFFEQLNIDVDAFLKKQANNKYKKSIYDYKHLYDAEFNRIIPPPTHSQPKG